MAETASPRNSCLCSTTSSETVEGSHRYKLEGFSNLAALGWGKLICSDAFTVGGYDWAICLYPGGSNSTNSSYFSAYVALIKKDAEVTASIDLTMLDQSGKGKHFTKTYNGHHFRSIGNDDYRKDCWRGHYNYYVRGELRNSGYIKDDSLVFLCNIRVVTTCRRPALSIPPANLGHCLKEILDTGLASDIIFKIGENLFNAHKVILAGRSQVFYAQFYGPLGNPKMDEIVVEDIPPLVFKLMLDFIYSDSLPNLNESESLPSPLVAQHLLAAADHYGLDRLRLFCEATLCDTLTSDTVASTLVLADQHNYSHLKTSCLKFITSKDNFGVVVKSDDFQNLEKFLLLEVMQMMAGKI